MPYTIVSCSACSGLHDARLDRSPRSSDAVVFTCPVYGTPQTDEAGSFARGVNPHAIAARVVSPRPTE